MKPFLRYSLSGLMGFVITAALFFGMLTLLKGKQKQSQTETSQINFSFVKDFDQAEVKPTPPRVKPEPQQVSQAPSMPQLMTDKPKEPSVELPSSNKLGQNLGILEGVKIPGAGGFYGGNNTGSNLSGGIKTALAPMYPQKQLLSKTEGWVKVLITVNEFGTVSNVEVLQAKPAREFNSAAIKAVKKWKFHPMIDGGQARPFQVTQTIEFKLDQ